MANTNAGIYGMLNKADFLCSDFFAVAPKLLVDAIFVSPPWGGPKYQVRTWIMLIYARVLSTRL